MRRGKQKGRHAKDLILESLLKGTWLFVIAIYSLFLVLPMGLVICPLTLLPNCTSSYFVWRTKQTKEYILPYFSICLLRAWPFHAMYTARTDISLSIRQMGMERWNQCDNISFCQGTFNGHQAKKCFKESFERRKEVELKRRKHKGLLVIQPLLH